MGDRELRSKILETARAMNARGINHGASGNVSARTAQGFLVTPSGKDYGECVPEDVVAMTTEGEVQGDGRPSSEWRIHRDLLAARPEVNAVLHAHPPFATALACLGRPIPAFHYMVAIAGGRDIRCAPYATLTCRARWLMRSENVRPACWPTTAWSSWRDRWGRSWTWLWK